MKVYYAISFAFFYSKYDPCFISPRPRGSAEQDRISRAVIEWDDVQWLLDSNSDALNTTKTAIAKNATITTTTSTTPISTAEVGPSQEAAANMYASSSCQDGDERPRIGDVIHDHCQRRRLRLVGGVDISFVKNREDDACATLVILEFPSLNMVYETHDRVTMEHPYMAGYLAFREV